MKCAGWRCGLIIIAAAIVSRGSSAQSVGTQARALLPKGPVTVDVLELWTPPRMNELRQRLRNAAQADPAWFQEHVRRAPPGQPLPYDPKLGLTEAEYKEFLRLADSVQMRAVRTETLVIEPIAAGWRFGPATTLSALRGLEIDTVANQVHSSFGNLAAASPIVPSPAQQATGRWGGPRWALEAVDSLTRTGTRAAFAVGKHESTGRTVIYFNAQRVASGQLTSQESLFLRFTH
jgi:hypothetical protein